MRPRVLEQLAISIKKLGILEPILVRQKASGEYELVAGERRYRAAKIAGREEVPVVVRELSDEEALHLSLIENLQREDLNPIDETEGILQLLSLKLKLSVQEVVALLYRIEHEVKGVTAPNVMGSDSFKTICTVSAQLGRPLLQGYCACHSCDNPRCINPAHLWEGTQAENIADCVSKGRQNPGLLPVRLGSKRAGAKLTEVDIPEIRKLLNLGTPQRLIALKYGVSQSLISRIKLGKIWQHVEE